MELEELSEISRLLMTLDREVGNPCYVVPKLLVKSFPTLSGDLGHTSTLDGDFRDTLGKSLHVGVCWPLLKIFICVLWF